MVFSPRFPEETSNGSGKRRLPEILSMEHELDFRSVGRCRHLRGETSFAGTRIAPCVAELMEIDLLASIAEKFPRVDAQDRITDFHLQKFCAFPGDHGDHCRRLILLLDLKKFLRRVERDPRIGKVQFHRV